MAVRHGHIVAVCFSTGFTEGSGTLEHGALIHALRAFTSHSKLHPQDTKIGSIGDAITQQPTGILAAEPVADKSLIHESTSQSPDFRRDNKTELLQDRNSVRNTRQIFPEKPGVTESSGAVEDSSRVFSRANSPDSDLDSADMAIADQVGK